MNKSPKPESKQTSENENRTKQHKINVIDKERKNLELIKKSMTEMKITLSSLRSQTGRKSESTHRKDKETIYKYPKRQHHWTKRAILSGSETSLW